MPMVDVQRRHAEVFRIRLGEKGSKGEPRKLTDSIRITSPSRAVVDAFAAVFGGDVRPWSGGEGAQFEVYLPTTELPVMVLPGQSISQWWEYYRGSVCERRCDGEVEQLSGQPCVCKARDFGELAIRMQTRDACRPTTRLSVLCPDVQVVGAGSLVTHGMVAAETLPQSVAVAEAALARGLMVPAVFRVIEHKGKRHYIVPQLEIVGVSLHQLTTGEVPAAALAAGSGRELAPPAPAALGSGGGEASDGASASREAPAGPRRPETRPPVKKANGDTAAPVDPDAMTPAQNRMIQALLHGLHITDEVAQRAELGTILGRTVESRGGLSKAEATTVIDVLKERQKTLAAAGGAK